GVEAAGLDGPGRVGGRDGQGGQTAGPRARQAPRQDEHAEHGRGVGQGHDVAQEGRIARAQRIEDGEHGADAREEEEPAYGREDGGEGLPAVQPGDRVLEAEADVVVAGGVAEERGLRIVAEEVELEAQAEGEEDGGGQERRRPSRGAPGTERGRAVRAPFVVPSARVLRRGYLPAARMSVLQLWSPQLSVIPETPSTAGVRPMRNRSAAPETAAPDFRGMRATSLS